jgi:hypothetical protein
MRLKPRNTKITYVLSSTKKLAHKAARAFLRAPLMNWALALVLALVIVFCAILLAAWWNATQSALLRFPPRQIEMQEQVERSPRGDPHLPELISVGKSLSRGQHPQ